MAATIRIKKGTIVGRVIGGRKSVTGNIYQAETWEPITLLGTVYVEAAREADGSWRYKDGGEEYICPGFAGVLTPLLDSRDWLELTR